MAVPQKDIHGGWNVHRVGNSLGGGIANLLGGLVGCSHSHWMGNMMIVNDLPSGKRLHNYGFLIGKSTGKPTYIYCIYIYCMYIYILYIYIVYIYIVYIYIHCIYIYCIYIYTGWWFQTWLLFSISYMVIILPNWLIFFKMVKTTNK